MRSGLSCGLRAAQACAASPNFLKSGSDVSSVSVKSSAGKSALPFVAFASSLSAAIAAFSAALLVAWWMSRSTNAL